MPEACDLDILYFKGDSHSTIAANIWNWNEHWSSSLQVQPLPKEGHSSIKNEPFVLQRNPSHGIGFSILLPRRQNRTVRFFQENGCQ